VQRVAQLEAWLHGLYPAGSFALAPASADASFRRYFRITRDDGTLIAMDAPPERENCERFLHVAKLFAEAGVHVPAVLAHDLAQGFVLLSDLGTRTYLDALQDHAPDALYRDAFAALVAIQAASRPGTLPPYSRELLRAELELFPEWYVTRHLGTTLNGARRRVLDGAFDRLVENHLAEAQVYVHRDYHSRNLMLSAPNPGVLDFQDAVLGPVSYDAVSLLKDAYVEWPEETALDWLIRYWELARARGVPVPEDFGAFYRDYELMGIQRHLKVLGIFARLFHRDGKDGYLKDMPLVMRHLRSACDRYREFGPLLALIDELEQRPRGVGYTF
jgi:N-acetylmuramate 1-kinase